MAANAILTPMRDIRMELEASQQIGHACPWHVQHRTVSTWFIDKHGHFGGRLELSRYPGHGCPGRCV